MSEKLGTLRGQSGRNGFDTQTSLPTKIPVAFSTPVAISPSKPWVKQSRGFVVTVVFILLIEYLLYNGVILLPSVSKDCLAQKNCRMWTAIDAAIFHLFFILVIISYIRCIKTDPGRIPKHWAFYRGDRAKRRRYCKECNAWKPDRAHHCSACCRCVLNMDHHCPWINNCVGFQNRKYFMLLLVYGVLGLSLVTVQCAGNILQDMWNSLVLETYPMDPALLVATGFFGFGSAFLLLALVQFLSFHIRLVSANLTTIENLDTTTHGSSIYDVGLIRNCQQVFGSNLLLWWLPHSGLGGGPVGDGIRWPVAKTNVDSFP